MTVDYIRLLEELGIDIDPKRETARRVYCHCPFCGSEDESAHMGLMRDGSAWGCLRHAEHRGRSPIRIIRALSGWSYDQIAAYVGGQVTPDSIEALEKTLEEINNPKRKLDGFQTVRFPPEARVFDGKHPSEHHYLRYLRESRGFGKHTARVIQRFKLRWCPSGRFEWRILIPVIDRGRMYGFTARAIGRNSLRYVAEPPGDQIKHAVFNGDNCLGGLVLVICEGPMDAKKIDFFGRRFGISALALMGTSATPEQEDRIREIAKRYQRVVILLDTSAVVDALALQAQFRSLDPELGDLPRGTKDPGDLTPTECAKWARGTLQELHMW